MAMYVEHTVHVRLVMNLNYASHLHNVRCRMSRRAYTVIEDYKHNLVYPRIYFTFHYRYALQYIKNEGLMQQ